MLAIGSSLVVTPAADLPRVAVAHGAKLVVLNRDETPLDSAAQFRLAGGIGEGSAPGKQAALDPLDRGPAERPEREIDQMHAEVDDAAAAGLCRVPEPRLVRAIGVVEGQVDGEDMAERALPLGEVTRAHLDEMIEQARTAHAQARETFKNEPGPVDDAAKLLADMVALGDHIGVGRGSGPIPG